MEKIGDHVYVETEFVGCNPGFVATSSGIVMIDTPQKPAQAFLWRRKIQEIGELIYIINTDHHFDHALGNYYFGGDLVMHEGTMKTIASSGRVEKCKEWIQWIEPESASVIEPYFIRQPRLTYTDRMHLYLGDDVFELIHVTSHTQDETLVYVPSCKVLFAGDTVCTNGIPSMYQSHPIEWLDALRLIDTIDFEVLVPGHGKIGNKGSVQEFEGRLRNLIEGTQEMIDRGIPKETIIRKMRYEDAVHARYPSVFSEYFDHHMSDNVERLYECLTQRLEAPPSI